MELVKKETFDPDRCQGLFLGLLNNYERMTLCLVKTIFKDKFELILSDDQLLEIANNLLAQGKIKVLKFVSRGSGFFDGVVCRNHRDKKTVTAKLDEMSAMIGALAVESLITVLDVVRERPGLRCDIIDTAAQLIGNPQAVAMILDRLEKAGIILVDREHGSGEPFITTLS